MIDLFCKRLFVILAVLSLSSGAYAADILDNWYNALMPVDRKAISELLDDRALIELKDLEIEQTKEEFVEALDYWEEAIEGGSIEYKIDPDMSDNMYRVVVCYQFASNEMFTEELFLIKDNLIHRSVQQTLSDKCETD